MSKRCVFVLAACFSVTLSACGSGGEATSGTAGMPASGGAVSGSSSGGAGNIAGGATSGSAGQNGGVPSGGASTAGSSGGGVGGQAQPPGIYPVGSCSEQSLRTAPPAGKEKFKAEPVDEQFPFSLHWVGEWIGGTDPSRIGMQTMADLDDDGDLDFASGQRQTLPGGMVWWEQCSPDHWVGHKVGSGHKSQSAGDALDVDGDGLNDLLAGDSWYKNPGKSREMPWTRYDAKTPDAEELTVGDVTGDGKAEIMYVHNSFNPQFWSPGADPAKGFVKGLELEHPVQQGVAWGDLNGDKANDWLISKDYWYENDGTGKAFTAHAISATATFDPQPLTFIGDLDGDKDHDFAMSTHWLGSGNTSRLAWVENADGQGTMWTLHIISEAHKYTHGVVLADFDNDGDLDALWAQNVGPSFIYANDGHGAFTEHQIVDDFRGHTPRVGDADCDGDLDIAGSPWGDRGQASSGESVGEPPRDVLYLQNMTVERGGKAIFDAERQPYELGWREKPHCRK